MIAVLPSPAADETKPDPFLGRELIRIERLIEASYTRLRRRITPSYSGSKKSGDAFCRAAELVQSHGADPHAWVEAQFALNEFGSFPPPNHLGCAAALERWQKYVTTRHDDPGVTTDGRGSPAAADEVRCQLFYLENLRNRARLKDPDIFLRDGIPLRAYFRLLACPEELLAEVTARYGDAAKRQLRLNSGLLQQLETMTNQPTAHATLRPVRSILSASVAGAPVTKSTIIPFPR